MRNKILRFCLSVGLAGLTVLPAYAASSPLWIKGDDPKYPKNIYLTGVGISSDLDGARSNARAEVSKIFQAKVSQTATDRQTESSEAKGRKRGPALSSQQNETLTNVTTEGLLQGTEIADTWFDKKAKRYYALAVLNRTKTRASLSSDIDEKEETINSLQRQLPQAKTVMDKAKLLSKAVKLSRERADLVARRRIVDPVDVPDVGAENQTSKLESQLDECLGKIEFVVETTDDIDGRLKSVVTSKITEQGFKVIPSADEASADSPLLKVKCSLKVEPFDRGHPSWKFYNWSGTAELTDESGKTLESSAPSGQEGHLQDETAKAKARMAGAEALGKEVQNQISKYILGE